MFPWSASPVMPSLFRVDALAVIMFGLVGFIGAVILRYSNRYLYGQRGQVRYRRWFVATIVSVIGLICANNLMVMAAAWTVSGLCLHQLLTFFEERPQALMAAHKKFLLSRVADVLIFGGLALIGRLFDTMQIDELLRRAAELQTVSPALQLGGLLLSAGVIIRSAQLPFHGWLIQVMEAPTPVSALLHAGIVNMGGFVMIRLAALMGQLELAQLLLVIVGATTAVLAGLVMMTRVSIKVALAWSTCAQMGFMLLECGLGAYELALLHLVAHSLYKAHAFLSSGSRVHVAIRHRIAGHATPLSVGRLLVGAALGAVIALAVGSFMVPPASRPASLYVSGLIIAFAVAPLLVQSASHRGDRSRLVSWSSIRRLAVVVCGIVLFTLWYRGCAVIIPTHELITNGLRARLAVVVIAFTGLFVVQAIILERPMGALARRLYPHFLAGFYLDEFITFLTFRVWPPRTLRRLAISTPSMGSPVRQEQVA